MKYKIRQFLLFFLAMIIIGQYRLFFPDESNTYMGGPTVFFKGAKVYSESDILALRDGLITKLRDGTTFDDPKAFAKYVIARGTLSDSFPDSSQERFYVLPRLHPGLDTLHYTIIGEALVIFIYLIVYGRKKLEGEN
jgi:hypothetical protein